MTPALLATSANTTFAQVTFLSWLPTIAMITGILVVGALMMVFFHRRERQLKTLAALIANDLEEARALRQQLDEAHMRVSNMMGAAQRLAGKLDARVAALDTASLKMHATRAALPQRAAAPPTYSAAATSPAANTTPARTRPLAPEITPTQPVPASAHSAAATTPRATSTATVEAKPTLDPLTREVYQLADAGRSSLAIARDLNEQIGKVELILALRQ